MHACTRVWMCTHFARCLPITLLHFVSALQRITEKDQSIETCWNIHLWENMRLQMWMWQNGMQEPRSSVRLTCPAVHQFEGKAWRIGRNSGYWLCVLCHIVAVFTHVMDQLSSSGIVPCFIQAVGWKPPYCSFFPSFHLWIVAGYHIFLMSSCTWWTFLFLLSPWAFFFYLNFNACLNFVCCSVLMVIQRII